jgi:hypothetical protein
MANKQIAALGLHLLSVADKLFTLTTPVPGPLLFFTGHPNHGQRVFVPSQLAIQAQAECVTVSAVSLHSCITFVELLRGNTVAICASLQQRTVEPVAKPARFIDDMDFKAFSQPGFGPRHEFRGSKTMRRARRGVVILSHHDEFLPMDIECNLEQRALLFTFDLAAAGVAVTLWKTVYFFIERVSLPKTRPRPLHAISSYRFVNKPGPRALRPL